MTNLIHVGFWAKHRASCENVMPWETTYPNFPVANSATMDQHHLLQRLAVAESKASVVEYLGVSYCRICGTRNGHREFTLGDFRWPQGYVHYLRDHNVAIDPAFADFLHAI